jgi:macrolide-specific efflux system membrane fusion protein
MKTHSHGFIRPYFGILVALLIIAGLAWAGVSFWQGKKAQEPLRLQSVARENIENFISATGKLEPKHYVEVGAQVSGQVSKIYVEEGANVKAGDLVAEIDATVFRTRVQNAAASLEGKKAQLQQLEAELRLASQRAKKNVMLQKQDAVSEDALIESQTNVDILHAKIRAMEAQITADSALLEGDKATLGYAKIYAPIDGTVVSLAVREGQTLNANQNAPVLLKIANLNVFTLRADVSEADVVRIQKDMRVYFKTFGGGERRWYSSVRQVLPTPQTQNEVVLYQILIDVDNNDGRLMDAMTTQVFFVLGEAKDALVVPLGAIQRQGRKSTIKVQEGSKIIEREVRLGVSNRTHVQVLEGLKEGEKIVIGEQLRNAGTTPSGEGFRGPRRGF